MARIEKVKVICYGVGAMGRMTAKLLIEKDMKSSGQSTNSLTSERIWAMSSSWGKSLDLP